MLKSFLSIPILLLLVPTAALSTPVSDRTLLAQIPSVSQLSDVRPTDWAYQALQSLAERYGCISGYPDSTYRGDRTLSLMSLLPV
ncbi:MAG: S-layer homology domain-containing protein [Pleurocapsa sp.]